ncbi:saccharopine dehydrogenase NADP-binding domain-containing protein [Chitinibacter bivalviorum]|uniref:Saccharopine dehydrogenase NADP-binding domain-containing protein n=1 Tax=Chitinibacter bivalviorum TaxID=2739434 RepID=A0A7H9BFH8_9NEIS|nr:saccharopine dehydrogenase C-terminal domain-containing protein [Chitinibacter bivalviorum]QLG87463.1 saccharopine dehydrogenase NADP-binding domain-containing protein [Chitinibacter bivalviorum]
MTSATPVTIIGAGKIGGSIAKLLAFTQDYQVTVLDTQLSALEHLSRCAPVITHHLAPHDSLRDLLLDQHAVIAATAFDQNASIALAALEAGVSYFDLTEDVATTLAIRKIAKSAKAGQIFMPQCGLAPGFVGILAHDMAQRFDRVDTVKMRVGALPQYPSNAMKYNLTWSTDGLINEYCNQCEAIKHGRAILVQALEGLEHFSLDGLEYEAFNTSGGLGTLCETWAGQIANMDYKTVRYVGHRDLMDFVINGLKMGATPEKRQQLKYILEESVPITFQDVVLIFVTASGQINGQFRQITDARKIYHCELFGELWSAIQLTTAASAAAVLDMHCRGMLPTQGFVAHDTVKLPDFLANRFGQYYAIDRYAQEVPV